MGIEPTTPGATVQCSNQLSYGHRAKPQGPNRTGALAQRLAFHLPGLRARVVDDRLARHPGGRIGPEENAGVRDLLDLAPASHADARGDRVVRLLAVRPRLLEHVQVALGLHRPRRDAVHANALASPGGAELACERDDTGLGGPVVRHHGGPVDARDRRKIDDGAARRLLHHLAPGPLAAEERAGQVDADDRVPAVGRDVLRLGAERRAGVVYHDVEPAPLLDHAIDHPLDLLLLTHVNRRGERPLAEITDGLDDGLEVLELARAERHVRAGAGELDRDGFADAGTAAGDDGGFSLERER